MNSSSQLPHILLIGSTGRTGRLIVPNALSRGYTVTALAREPSTLNDLINGELSSEQRGQLDVVKGTPTSADDLKTAIQASLLKQPTRQIVIISTLGQTRKTGNPWSATTSPPLFMTEAAQALFSTISSLDLSSRSRIQKLIVMSAFGTNESFENLHCLLKPVMRYSNMAQTVEDHDALDKLVRQQADVKYVLVRCPMLKVGEARAVTVRDEDGKGEGWIPSSISLGSVVEFMLDAVVSDEWDGKAPVIVN